MSDFRYAGRINDDDQIRIYDGWDSESEYYLVTNKGFVDSDHHEKDLFINIFDPSNRVELSEFSHIDELNRLVFIRLRDRVRLTVDPLDIVTRDQVLIYKIRKACCDDDNEILHVVKWWDTQKFPFDRNFFKIGHPYMIKLNTIHKHTTYALLESMTFDELCFVYLEEDTNFDTRVRKTYRVSANQYRKLRPNEWFTAVIEADQWIPKEEK